jgi:glucoamylase
MRNSLLFLISLLSWAGSAQAGSHTDINTWVQFETTTAAQFMMNNVSQPNTARGSVIAAPSSEPNYYYHWIRDGAITMDAIVTLYQQVTDANYKAQYLQALTDYVSFSRQNQLTPNRSGGADALGLGEPKFNLDGTAFQGDWGRPQNDGPAIRASTLIRFAMQLLSENDPSRASYVRQVLYDSALPSNSVIKNDLEYVAAHWQDPSFDLWEEVKGTHFFTRMVQRRALVDGANLAEVLGDTQAANYYHSQVSAMESQIEQHWDSSKGSIVETINQLSGIPKASGLDSAIVLGALHGATDDRFMSVTDDRVFVTAEKMRQAFATLYPINQRLTDWNGQPMGTSIGRYPEDTFNGGPSRDGGNPWFLATNAFAEFYYQCANLWQKDGIIPISDMNGPILASLPAYTGGSLQAGDVVTSSDARFAPLIHALRDAGDRELWRVYYHSGTDGSMSEEFDRTNGYMTSAPNLTWSYASLLTAVGAR